MNIYSRILFIISLWYIQYDKLNSTLLNIMCNAQH